MLYFIGIADKRIPTIATQNNRIQGLALFTERAKAETHIRDLKSRSKFDILEIVKELLVPDFIMIANTFYTTMRNNKQGIIHRLPSTHFGDMPIYLDLVKPEVTGGANFNVAEFLKLSELQQTAARDDLFFYHNGYTVSIEEKNGQYVALIKYGAYDSIDDLVRSINNAEMIQPTTLVDAKKQALELINEMNMK